MQTYQAYSEMDHQILAQDRKFNRAGFTLAQTDSYKQVDSFPRTFQPLAMNSPLSTDQFAVWPPTPRNPDQRPTATEAPYPFTMPEDCNNNVATSAPWDGSMNVASEQVPATTGMDVPHSYGSPINDNAEWSRTRGGYGALLRSGVEVDQSSIASSPASGLLGPSGYGFTHGAPRQDDLSVNTNLPRRLSDAASLSSGADQVPSTGSTDYFIDDSTSCDGPFMTPSTDYGLSATPLSPASIRSVNGNRRRLGSASPSRSVRTHPYDVTKRWSTGNQSNYGGANVVDPQLQGPQFHSHHSSPVCGTSLPSSLSPQPYLPSHTHEMPRAVDPYLQSSFLPRHDHIMPNGFCIPSHGNEAHSNHYSEFSEPPNLYGSIHDEQIPPPPEDMDPEDPDLRPHEQDLRFEGDLYTPRWVRNHGNKREGWCGICKPGRWLVLKNSAFWYDKSFTHGISAATGVPFHEPREMRRMDGNPDVWEGLCHSCNEWVPLVSNKKKGTTWFRHAYKCHTHNKAKDVTKRRRESHAKVKVEA